MPNVDGKVKSNIGANICHLLFVKYEKDPILAKKILLKCLKIGVDLNHVDSLKAAPIHVAIRKRQYQAISDCVSLNKKYGKQVVDVNIKDKRGITPLHYSIEKQDYEMFQWLLLDPYIDPFAVDNDFMRPRKLTVIFSAFHKMLYSREKIYMRRKFSNDLAADFVDF